MKNKSPPSPPPLRSIIDGCFKKPTEKKTTAYLLGYALSSMQHAVKDLEFSLEIKQYASANLPMSPSMRSLLEQNAILKLVIKNLQRDIKVIKENVDAALTV